MLARKGQGISCALPDWPCGACSSPQDWRQLAVKAVVAVKVFSQYMFVWISLMWLASRDAGFNEFIYFPPRCLWMNLVLVFLGEFTMRCSVPSTSTNTFTIAGRSQCFWKAQSLLCTTYSKQCQLGRAWKIDPTPASQVTESPPGALSDIAESWQQWYNGARPWYQPESTPSFWESQRCWDSCQAL